MERRRMSAAPTQSLVSKIIPTLSQSLHKGSCGRIGILGGSVEYTGSPFFAGIAALRTGADLCYILCHKEAAPIIKGYSPELIVYPYFESDRVPHADALPPILPRLHALIVGPGLSRNAVMLQGSLSVIKEAQKLHVPLVIDADGLVLVQEHPEVFKGYHPTVLTPNLNEFKRLCTTFNVDAASDTATQDLANALGNVTIVNKGHVDIISNGITTRKCVMPSGARRSGGQGDLLAGAMGTFLAWASIATKSNPLLIDSSDSLTLDCALAACMLVKTVSLRAFEKQGRSVAVPDMIPEISRAFEYLFEGVDGMQENEEDE